MPRYLPNLFLFLLLGFAGPYAQAAPDYIDRNEILEDFEDLSQTPWAQGGLALLKPFLDVRDSEGLYVIEEYERNSFKVASVRRFAKLLHEKYELDLVLISRWKDLSYPAFDGVVLDKAQNPIANFQVKSRRFGDEHSYLAALSGGFEKADEYSKPEAWVRYLQTSTTWAGHVDSAGEIVNRLNFMYEPRAAKIQLTEEKVAQLVSIFAPGGSRPLWIFADVSGGGVPPSRLQLARPLTRASERGSLFVANGTTLVTMLAGRAQEGFIEPCDNVLLRPMRASK